MKISDSMTTLGTVVSVGGSVRSSDLDKIAFLQVPSRKVLTGSEAGRVQPIYGKAEFIFD